jgi:hypothetical protein
MLFTSKFLLLGLALSVNVLGSRTDPNDEDVESNPEQMSLTESAPPPDVAKVKVIAVPHRINPNGDRSGIKEQVVESRERLVERNILRERSTIHNIKHVYYHGGTATPAKKGDPCLWELKHSSCAAQLVWQPGLSWFGKDITPPLVTKRSMAKCLECADAHLKTSSQRHTCTQKAVLIFCGATKAEIVQEEDKLPGEILKWAEKGQGRDDNDDDKAAGPTTGAGPLGTKAGTAKVHTSISDIQAEISKLRKQDASVPAAPVIAGEEQYHGGH